MKTHFKTLVNGIRESFGQPIGLMRLFNEYPEIRVSLEPPTRCIAAETVAQWQSLGVVHFSAYRQHHKRGTLMGWKSDGNARYSSFTLHRQEYEHISQCVITEDWACDIADVDGFLNSKSRLKEFESTDAMVEANSREMISEITHAKLEENLAHREIRIIHSPTTVDWFCRSLWDGRLFLINSGGSHHFAAAKYIAARLPASVPLRGRLKTYSLNALAIASLRRDFEMFAISDDATVSYYFHDAMNALRATWLWHPLPAPFDDAKAILLPRSESRSMRVANLFRKEGVIDLGHHLADLAAKQSRR